MRDRDNSVGVGGDNTGPIVQAEKYYQNGGQWAVVAVSLTAIAALAVVAFVALRDDDVAGAAVGAPDSATTVPLTTADPTTTQPETGAASPPTTAPGTTASETTASQTTAPRPPFRRLHSERAEVRRTNVDVDPPQPAPGGAGAAYTLDWLPGIGGGPPTLADLYAGGYPPAAPNRVAEWTGGGVPGPEQCLDQIRRFGTRMAPLAVDGVYCVVSPQGRVVVLSEVEFTDRMATGLITVWAR